MRFKIHTLGCRVNQYEGQNIREQLKSAGYSEAAEQEIADLVVVNSCSVTEDADRDSLYWVRKLKRENPNCRVAFTGCGAGTVKVEADWIIPSEKKSEFLSIISGCFDGPVDKKIFQEQPITFLQHRTRAFLKIQDGCDNVCSFCKIRIVRGRSRSRELGEIIEEAERLVASGHQEIVLVGILLGRWGLDLENRPTLTDALRELVKIESLARIRLSSIEPEDVTDELIDFIADNPKVCPHLHMPLQSGDDDILNAMRRVYDSRYYIDRVRRLRARVPNFCLTADVMVGFPGETEEQAKNTLNVLKETQILKAHLFPFSEREGTYAAKLPNHLSTHDKRARLQEISEALEPTTRQAKESFLGQTMSVLMEENESEGWRLGHAANFLSLYVPVSEAKAGEVLTVTLESLYRDGIKCKKAS